MKKASERELKNLLRSGFPVVDRADENSPWYTLSLGEDGEIIRTPEIPQPEQVTTVWQTMDIDTTFAIGGIGLGDGAETWQPDPNQYQHGKVPAGTQVCPAGTTYGQSDPDGCCFRCGVPANWNPCAGQNLCARHWDEY